MGNLDEAKGKAKQAVGDLTGDDDLRREGKVDEKAGQVKDKVGDLKDKAEDVIDKVEGQGHRQVGHDAVGTQHDGRRRRRGVPVTHDHEFEVPFADRDAAGAALAAVLTDQPELAAGDPVVVALPRGGVPVGRAGRPSRSARRST